MDPISAAGIGLSLASLCLQVFAGCIKAFDLLNSAVDMPVKYQYLRTRLCLEQTRLLNWGEQAGLLEEMLHSPSHALQMSRNVVLDVLLEMQAAFRSCLKITTKYDALILVNDGSLQGATQKQSAFLRKARSYWTGAGDTGARLYWAMIKNDSFEGLIFRIVAFNDRMEGILDRSAIKELRSMQEKSNLLLLQIAQQVEELKDLAGGLQIGAERPELRSPSFSRSSTLLADGSDQTSHLSTLAAFKMHVVYGPKASAANSMRLGDEDINIGLVMPESGYQAATVGVKSAWVEWRELLEDECNHLRELDIENRLSELASLLNEPQKPAAFRTPHCLGYCREALEGEIRYGLVYEIPESKSSNGSSFSTLRHHLLQSRTPSLTVRLTLASQIAETLLYLHAVNWLHKGFQSNSILFFHTDGKMGSKPSLLEPIISGFDFSRLDVADMRTVKSRLSVLDETYKHPELQGNSSFRSSKIHDLYALGIILIEIALWKPIDKIMAGAFGKTVTRSMTQGVRRRLLEGSYGEFDTVMTTVAAQVGDTYVGVVGRCIEGGKALGLEPRANQEYAQVGSKLQGVFYDEVYLKLKSISA